MIPAPSSVPGESGDPPRGLAWIRPPLGSARSEARPWDGRGGAGDESVRSSAAFDETGDSFQNASGLVSEVSRYGGTGDSFESESFLGGDESLALSESNM